ncbi:MAG: Fic family protein [Deltaproteobacteria bacterium]|nr:Fic family protein [Deltaproteobacteria bacterium]
MRKSNRYDTSALPEARFEPNSRKRVLKNLLGIKSKREMDRIEALAQLPVMEKLSGIYGKERRFTAADIRSIHKIWLGRIYEWAGQYRSVNVSKEDFPFAAANQIPRLMDELERDALKKYTPCRFSAVEDVARAIAVVHTEIVLIHPFREGNGRVARILSALMALQAGLPSLDFSRIKAKKRQEYFAAVRAGMDKNYKPMEKIFSAVISRTLRTQKG